MVKTYTSVSRYMQGADAIDLLAAQIPHWGETALLITDTVMQQLLGERLQRSFEAARQGFHLAVFNGEVTRDSIDTLSAQARALGADVIVGIGGGKALDTAKGVALAVHSRMISVPTIAATDAPASFAIAVYNDQHLLTDILKMPRNPDLLLVDTAIIAQAPVRFLIAGIGDAISKKFEVEACTRANADMLMGGKSTHTGRALAQTCYQLIRTHAVDAIAAVRNKRPDDALEALIEATVLLSTLAFENGGLSVAHAIAKGLPMVKRAEASLHGEHVAYGLLVQLILEKRADDELAELLAFYRKIKLPYSLEHIGINGVRDDELAIITTIAMTSPSVKRFDQQLDAEQLRAAILAVEALSE